jgi:hypothetical protein
MTLEHPSTCPSPELTCINPPHSTILNSEPNPFSQNTLPRNIIQTPPRHFSRPNIPRFKTKSMNQRPPPRGTPEAAAWEAAMRLAYEQSPQGRTLTADLCRSMAKCELSIGEQYDPEPHEAEEYYAWLNGERGPLYSDSEEDAEAVSARRRLPAERRGGMSERRSGGQGFGGMSGGHSRYALEGRSGSRGRQIGQSHGKSHAGHSRSGAKGGSGAGRQPSGSHGHITYPGIIQTSAGDRSGTSGHRSGGGSPVEIPIREAVEAARGVEERRLEATEILITEVMVGDRTLRSEVDG